MTSTTTARRGGHRPRTRRVLLALLATLLVAAGLTATNTVGADRASALSGSEFNPENIIADSLFYDANAMTQDGIQGFLNSKVSCQNSLCLATGRFPSASRAADAMCQAYSGGGNESAAAIIFKVQQACSISAKVILVTLQKEQGLITDPAPTTGEIYKAMGYACPDTAACDTAYYGFFNQVYSAAHQFQRYGNPPGTSNFFTWFPVGSPSAVQYNPTPPPGCKAPVITIRNKATAALYYYTPYQPNDAALANLYGRGDDCSSYGNRNFWVYYNQWFGPTTGTPLSPVGNFELATASLTQAELRGWVFDPETAAPINVHLYINGTYETGTWGGQFLADAPRLDVAQAYPSYGANHGFDIKFPVTAGSLTACLYGINVGRGDNVLLGCKTVATPTGPPRGNIDSISLSADRKATINGWAIDPDTAGSIAVHVYVNGAWGGAFTADATRNDVAKVYPDYGAKHGYSVTVPVPVGTNTICVYGINVGGGDNSQLSCRDVSSASGPPIGTIDSATVNGMTTTVSGWALDPDGPDSIAVHAYIDGAWGGAYTADGTRNDVAKAYDGYGAAHGFTIPLTLTGGAHQICLYGINLKAGYNSQIGCKTVNTPTGSPVGSVDSATVSGATATVSGWALDPDTAASITVHAYVNDQWGGAFSAAGARADVAKAYPGYGTAHGFSFQVPVPVGSSKVCVYGINQSGSGGNSLVQCVAVTR